MKAQYRRYIIRSVIVLVVLGFFFAPYIKFPSALTYDSTKSMVLVAGANFTSGGVYTGDYDESTEYTQDLRAYWIGVREVSEQDFVEFQLSRGLKPPMIKATADLPVSGVNWYEAVEYCNWLSAKQGLPAVYTINGTDVRADWTAGGYRLPSEAEWENAMKGGVNNNSSVFPGSGNPNEVAHFRNNSTEKNRRGTLKPNELGLYDMAGNVAEWVWDFYGMYPSGNQVGYKGPPTGEFKVIRGGAYDDSDFDMRVTDRNYRKPEEKDPTMGFRVARTATGADALVRGSVATAAPLPPVPADAAYKNPDKPIAERAADLLGRMSLEEKIGQLTQIEYPNLLGGDSVTTLGLGSLLTGGDSQPGTGTAAEWSGLVHDYQKAALASRLGIPILFGMDSVHGAGKIRGATIFPHNIGLGAANDPVLVEKMGAITADEMHAGGLTWNFAPCVAVAQDERWGRTYESFSENPRIASLLGAAYIRGLQGKTLGPGSVAATAKHFLADGGTVGGQDRGNAVISEAELRRLHLVPYIEAVKVGAATIMASFSSWNDVQMHANKKLLTDVLRKELGFKGVLVSDWGAQKLLPGSPSQQIKAIVNAGVDVCMVPDDIGRNGYIETLRTLVLGGEVPLARIDEAVSRMLMLKFTMGLFEKPYGEQRTGIVGSAVHRQVARELVAKSLVVLKNDQVLPLRQKTIWLAGPLANDSISQCGGWTMGWQTAEEPIAGVTTIGTAIQARAKARGIAVTMMTGADFPGGAKPELAIVVAGEHPYAEMGGDRKDLRLAVSDRNLIQSLKKAGIPVLLVLVSGRPMIVTELLPSIDGLVAAWLPGSEGAGVADVLFGDVKASGRLPVSWPESNEQIPVNQGDGKKPLFPFGFGLDL